MANFAVLILGVTTVLNTLCTSDPVVDLIFVNEPPSTFNFRYIRGGQVPCSAHGYPVPLVTWHFQDGTLVNEIEDLRKITPYGTLEFPAIIDSQYDESIHSNVYVCHARNAAGTIRSRDVIVNGVPSQSYSISLHDQTAMRGNTVVFKCVIPSFVKDYVDAISWTRANEPISVGERFSILPSGELHIRDLTDNDSQYTYRCNVRDAFFGINDQAQAGLSVVAPVNTRPEVINSQASLTSLVDSVVEIPCVAIGHPLPTYSWKKDDVELILDTRMGMRGGNLVISDVTLLDDGDYTCDVSNKLGSEKANVHLSVREPISVYFYPYQRTVDVGDSASFNCSVTGHPIDIVTWYKDAIPLDGLPGISIFENGTMVVDAMRRGDQGMYQCVAGNMWEFQEASMHLSLGASAPSLVDAFVEESLQPGPNLNLICIVAGNPSPDVTWYLDDEAVVQNKRIAINQFLNVDTDVVSYLNITRTQVRDGGSYRCQATSENGVIFHEARINIFGPPMVRPFTNVTAIAGGVLNIRCYAAGFPIGSIKWYKDTHQLPSNGRQEVESDGTLRINNVRKGADDGKYSCQVDNGHDQFDTKHVYITVKVPPKIVPISNVILREGERMQMMCSVTSGDTPITFSWLKDDQPIPDNIGVTIHDIVTGSLLLADSITIDLAGNYTCIANNSAATVRYTLEVVVFVPPTFTVFPTDTQVVLNHTAVLHCSASGYPVPVVIWMRAHELSGSNFVAIEKNTRISVAENGELVIREVVEEDGGVYICFINNTIDVDSKTAQLIVYIPARFDDPEVNMTARINEEVILDCTPDGHGELNIVWYKDDIMYTSLIGKDYQIITETGDYLTSRLRVFKVKREDTAVYTCQASNIYGSDRRTFYLTILEPPEAPRDLRDISVTSRSFTIGWSSGFHGNSIITGYTIEYKNDSDAWQGNVPRIQLLGNLTQLRHTISDLHPAYVYVVRIKAFNAIGVSQMSEDKLIKTYEEAPSGQPVNIEVNALSSTRARIVWRQPRADLQNGDIQGYYIRYKEVGTSTPPQSVMTSLITHYIETYTLEPLRKFTEYSIDIQAFNKVGTGPWSEREVVMTLEDVPSEPPPSVRAMPLGSTIIRIMWSTPPLESLFGILRGYKVFYKPVTNDQDESDTKTEVTTDLTIDLIGLKTFTNYSIQVVAYTRIGDGVRSQSIQCMTNQDYPSKPADIKAHANTSTSIMVSWLPPLQINGILQMYILTMEHISTEGTITTNFTLAADTTQYLIYNLEMDQEYDFFVKAATIIGAGMASDIVTAITMERVPARIMSFSRKIIITWKHDATLECLVVGDPEPIVIWRKEGFESRIRADDHYEILRSGALVIHNAMPRDKGNYSCQASNTWGTSDETHVGVNVLVSSTGTPPAAPTLKIASSTTETIQVNWLSGGNGGSPLLGFTLHYKREHDFVWERVNTNATLRTFTFVNLMCGTNYQFYLTTYNQLGTSQNSNELLLKTDGSIPIPPSIDMILMETNATLSKLNLNSFVSGGCPIESFTIQHQLLGYNDWTMSASNIPAPLDIFIIEDLHPATWYVIRVTAVNSAGRSVYGFRIATKAYTGGTVPPLVFENEQQEQGSPYYGDPKIFVPVLGGLIVFILLCIIAIALYRNTNHWKTKQATTIATEGCLMTINMESNIRREDIGAPYEHEPFLVEGGTPLNNLNNSTKNWIFSPNDDIDACQSVNLHVIDPNINSTSSDSFTTFQYPTSHDFVQGAVGGAIYSTNEFLHETAPKNKVSIGIEHGPPPPLPERPLDLYSKYKNSYINSSRKSSKRDLSRSRTSVDTSYSSAQEELTSHYTNRRHSKTTMDSESRKQDFIITHNSSSNSDIDNGIRHFSGCPPNPTLYTDSSSPEHLERQGARPRERSVGGQSFQSSDACESDYNTDDRYSNCHRPNRTKGGNKNGRKPVSKTKRNGGRSRRHGRRNSSTDPRNSSNQTSQKDGHNANTSDGYASCQYAAASAHQYSSMNNLRNETKINESLSEPENSRTPRQYRTRRQTSTPAPQTNRISNERHITSRGAHHDTREGKHVNSSRSPLPYMGVNIDHNEDIEIEVLSPEVLTNTQDYVEEFTIV